MAYVGRAHERLRERKRVKAFFGMVVVIYKVKQWTFNASVNTAVTVKPLFFINANAVA
jgi:hypothetical protein